MYCTHTNLKHAFPYVKLYYIPFGVPVVYHLSTEGKALFHKFILKDKLKSPTSVLCTCRYIVVLWGSKISVSCAMSFRFDLVSVYNVSIIIIKY